MYQSTYSRGSYDPSQFQTFVSQFIEWMKKYVEFSVTGDSFQILSDLKLICELIIRVCPLQALIDVSQLDNQECNIESTYHYLCDRLNIPTQFRFNRNIFVYRDAQMLQNCLQSLVSTFILYNSPEKLELPDVLIERCSRYSSRLSQSDRSSCISNSNSKSRPVYNPPPPNGNYYRPVGGNGFYQQSFHDNRSYNSSSIPTLSVAPSLDSDGANSVSASPRVYTAAVPDETPLFTPVQSQIQVNRQELFLEELEQEKKKEQLATEEDKSGSSNQLQSPRNSTNHLSLNSNESCSESDNDIAEETIIPRDKHVEKQEKKKKFWKTIAAIGATVGVVAGTVLAVAAATSKGDDTDSE